MSKLLRQRSCAACAQGKRSCDHAKPSCGRCTQLGIECVVSEDKRRKEVKRKLDDDSAIVVTSTTFAQLNGALVSSEKRQKLQLSAAFASRAMDPLAAPPLFTTASLWLQKAMSLSRSFVNVINIMPAYPFSDWHPTSPAGRPSVDPSVLEQLEKAIHARMVSSPVPTFRVTYDTPSPDMVLQGLFLKPTVAYMNSAFTTGVGMPACLATGSKLCRMDTPGKIASHVHPEDRVEYVRNAITAVLQHCPVTRSCYRAHQALGWTRVEELCEMSYDCQGFLQAVTVSLVKVDKAPCIPYPKDILRMADAQNSVAAKAALLLQDAEDHHVRFSGAHKLYTPQMLTQYTETRTIQGVPLPPVCLAGLMTVGGSTSVTELYFDPAPPASPCAGCEVSQHDVRMGGEEEGDEEGEADLLPPLPKSLATSSRPVSPLAAALGLESAPAAGRRKRSSSPLSMAFARLEAEQEDTEEDEGEGREEQAGLSHMGMGGGGRGSSTARSTSYDSASAASGQWSPALSSSSRRSPLDSACAGESSQAQGYDGYGYGHGGQAQAFQACPDGSLDMGMLDIGPSIPAKASMIASTPLGRYPSFGYPMPVPMPVAAGGPGGAGPGGMGMAGGSSSAFDWS